MIMIYGPAGSGKSTQGELLAKRIGGKALSVGQICRERFLEYTKTAAMVPEDKLTEAILEEIKKCEDAGFPVVLDNQPWTKDARESAEKLWALAELVVVIDVPREECLNRLSSRGRDDDQIENWTKKLDMYEERMAPYMVMLEEFGVKPEHVDGVGSVKEVSDRIYSLYKKIVQN